MCAPSVLKHCTSEACWECGYLSLRLSHNNAYFWVWYDVLRANYRSLYCSSKADWQKDLVCAHFSHLISLSLYPEAE